MYFEGTRDVREQIRRRNRKLAKLRISDEPNQFATQGLRARLMWCKEHICRPQRQIFLSFDQMNMSPTFLHNSRIVSHVSYPHGEYRSVSINVHTIISNDVNNIIVKRFLPSPMAFPFD